MNFNFKLFAELMKANRYTNPVLAKEIGVSHVLISDWKNGKSIPSLTNIEKIMKIFKIERIDDILIY